MRLPNLTSKLKYLPRKLALLAVATGFCALAAPLYMSAASAQQAAGPLSYYAPPWKHGNWAVMQGGNAQGADNNSQEAADAYFSAANTGITPPAYLRRNPNAPAAPIITPAQTQKILDDMHIRAAIEPRSAIEMAYSSRIVDNLRQFGYDMFGSPETNTPTAARSSNTNNASNDRENWRGLNNGNNDDHNDGRAKFALPAGAVQDDFVLNIGDTLDIAFRGEKQGRKNYTITNQGLLIVDDMAPISAAGRTIGDIRQTLEEYAHRMRNTEVFVALSDVKQINVLVAGHVHHPGRQHLTVFHSVLDALMEAGGVEKTGSLRQIKLIRNGRSTLIDLYSLMVYGSDNMDMRLRDGDRIMVPPIGPTVAVAGNVKRPGIYEILPALRGQLYKPQGSSQKLSLEDLLAFSGGILTPGQNRFMELALTSDGKETVNEIRNNLERKFGDGDILMVSPSKERREGMVELAGDTRRPGMHDLGRNKALSDLLGDENVFGPDIYPLLGVIERWNDDQLTEQLIPFPPLLVLKGKFDRKLKDGDIVHLFSRKQMAALSSGVMQGNTARQDARNARPGSRSGLYVATDYSEDDGMTVPRNEAYYQPTSYGDADPAASARNEDTILENPAAVSFLMERAALVRGAVRQPGAYPVAEGITLRNLLAVAGGLMLEADTGAIEVTSKNLGEGQQKNGRSGTLRKMINFHDTSPDDVLIGAGDKVRINQKFQKVSDNSVLLIGEVKNPGRYDLLPGDTMLSLMERAGGLTNQAYPDGAIFSRENARRAEEARFKAEARDLEANLASALNQKDPPKLSQINAVQDVITQLKQAQAVGRITVEADPAVLKTDPALDILLQPKDRIYIPPRPLTVRVMGEVLSPASLQFRTDKDPSAYIAEAGGFTYNADKGRTFVIYPDGSAQPLQVSAWNHNATYIPPGSTIIVPRDPKPFDFLQTTRDITQILANLAFSGVVINDIRN